MYFYIGMDSTSIIEIMKDVRAILQNQFFVREYKKAAGTVCIHEDSCNI